MVNTVWKYHQFENLNLSTCDRALEFALGLVDVLVPCQELYREAFLRESGCYSYDASARLRRECPAVGGFLKRLETESRTSSDSGRRVPVAVPQISKNGARGGNRTRTALTGQGILSPLRLPVPPPGHGLGPFPVP